MAEHNRIGQIGEQLAADLIKKKGYQILAANWKFKNLEIDIIAANRKEIVFVEVKTRTSTFGGRPEDAVDRDKRRHLLTAARAYLSYNHEQRKPRFDVISIILKNADEIEEIKHFEDAFAPPVRIRTTNSFISKWRWFRRH